ncbi:hypothetical protein [Buttiauxella gaviniae]|uniref:hypothetical protein n=1 Tax=Buttiauxella gaviniae TaxID=82990 RepID=UPI0039AF3929
MEKNENDIFKDLFSMLDSHTEEPQEAVTPSVTPTLPQEAVTPSVTPTLPQEAVTSSVIPTLPQEAVTSSVTPTLPQEAVTSPRKRVRTIEEVIRDKKIEKSKLFYKEFENQNLDYSSDKIIKVDIAINGKVITEKHIKGNKTERDIYQDIINNILKSPPDDIYDIVVISSNNLTIVRFLLASLSRKGIKITTRTDNINELINVTINKYKAMKVEEGTILMNAYNTYCENINKNELNFENNKSIFDQYNSHIAHKNDKVYNDTLKKFISGSN